MKHLIFTILFSIVILTAFGQVGNYEYIDLKRGNWPHISFEENGQRIARIQGVDGNFSITSTNGAIKHFSLNSLTGNVGIGTFNPSEKLAVRSEFNDIKTISIGLKPSLNDNTQGGLGVASGGLISLNAYNNIIFQTDGGNGYKEHMRIRADGNIGIGTSNAASKLEVNGDISLSRIHKIKFLETVNGNDRAYIRSTNNEAGDYNSLIFAVGVANESVIFKSNGKIGMGTMDPDSDALLTVKGAIHSTEIKVLANAGVPDYVFEDSYDLRTLSETKKYIQENRHLPEIPSAMEIDENGGFNVGEMNMLLLKKIEELTLYQIELLERIETLEKKVE